MLIASVAEIKPQKQSYEKNSNYVNTVKFMPPMLHFYSEKNNEDKYILIRIYCGMILSVHILVCSRFLFCTVNTNHFFSISFYYLIID